MNIDLNEWRTRLVLEALDEKWVALIEAVSARGDEDTAAEYGNDLMMLMTLREELEEVAIKAFNANITNFSHEAFVPEATSDGEQSRHTAMLGD